MHAHLDPMIDAKGNVVLYDIYVDGVWHGSKRTYPYCQDYLSQLGWTTNGDDSRTTDPPGSAPDHALDLHAK